MFYYALFITGSVKRVMESPGILFEIMENFQAKFVGTLYRVNKSSLLYSKIA